LRILPPDTPLWVFDQLRTCTKIRTRLIRGSGKLWLVHRCGSHSSMVFSDSEIIRVALAI
jgi:hypothetical protein